MSQDYYLASVLDDIKNELRSDVRYEILPLDIQARVMKAVYILKRLHSMKSLIIATEKKRKSLLTFNKAAITKEEQDYKFEYEKLEKEYLELIESISKDIKSRYNL
ncbi:MULTISPECIES: hypothetical protein [Metallosphaera]|uniref:hypothetical protein n=1 Tax=Metallosphaera TaxID=41980 RepID=UPI001F05ED7C|nr:hypothetical protein [Metallosphaera sedula]MCH1772157.1 hypothetical protein [Metallosphaera sedula]MCP6727702.1 hypothetical protein [Metallosphaera sedula]